MRRRGRQNSLPPLPTPSCLSRPAARRHGGPVGLSRVGASGIEPVEGLKTRPERPETMRTFVHYNAITNARERDSG